jgi:hypothetical protein
MMRDKRGSFSPGWRNQNKRWGTPVSIFLKKIPGRPSHTRMSQGTNHAVCTWNIRVRGAGIRTGITSLRAPTHRPSCGRSAYRTYVCPLPLTSLLKHRGKFCIIFVSRSLWSNFWKKPNKFIRKILSKTFGTKNFERKFWKIMNYFWKM